MTGWPRAGGGRVRGAQQSLRMPGGGAKEEGRGMNETISHVKDTGEQKKEMFRVCEYWLLGIGATS